MHNIPLEILNVILLNIAQCDYRERFPILTPESKRGILSARVVWAGLRTQNPLRQLFVRALEDKVFVISGPEDDRGWVSGLDEVSGSEYAYYIETLSFCPMVFVDGQLCAVEWPEDTLVTLRNIISRFPALNHLRFFTVPPTHISDEWCDTPDCDYCIQYYPPNLPPREVSTTSKRCSRPSHQAARSFARLELCVANSQLESLSMPYYGNRAPFCAVPWAYMTMKNPGYATSLRRVSINILVRRAMMPIFDDWIFLCANLEYVEIAMCRPTELDLPREDPMAIWAGGARREDVPVKLREIRVLADTGFRINMWELALGLHQFPALKIFALANAMFTDFDWEVFFGESETQVPSGWGLDVVWLLNPLYSADYGSNMVFERYKGDSDMADLVANGVTKEIRIEHVPFPWGEGKELRLGVGRGYSYPGFEVFEEER